MKTAIVCFILALVLVALTQTADARPFESPVSPVPVPTATPIVFEDEPGNGNNDQHETPEPRPTREAAPPAYPADFEPAPYNPDLTCSGDIDTGSVTCN